MRSRPPILSNTAMRLDLTAAPILFGMPLREPATLCVQVIDSKALHCRLPAAQEIAAPHLPILRFQQGFRVPSSSRREINSALIHRSDNAYKNHERTQANSLQTWLCVHRTMCYPGALQN